MKAHYTIALMLSLGCLLAACGPQQSSSDQVQRQQQEMLSQQGNAAAGMPAIVNFREKKLYKMILEMRDKELPTVTYTQDMNGKMHKLCDSIGYGIPYATQFTNPMRVARSSETPERGNVVLPQADPNGLFSPANAEGTWVLCANPSTHSASPVYVEPRIIVSPFPLSEAK